MYGLSKKNTGKISKSTFSINNEDLKSVTEFTCLGITINAGCSFLQTLKDLRGKAFRAIFAQEFRITNLKCCQGSCAEII